MERTCKSVPQIHFSNTTTSFIIARCPFMTAFPHTFFCQSPLFSYLSSISMLSWTLHILPSAICASIWFIFTIRGFVKKKFIMFYGTSLWFGIIKCSLYIYQPQIPVDHKDRLYQEKSILKGGKSGPSLKKKIQLYEMLMYHNFTTKIKITS